MNAPRTRRKFTQEGMNFGIHIIATRVGGIPEIVDDKKTGLLIEPDNLSQLEDAINTAICDKSLLQYFSIITIEKCQVVF